MTYPTQEDYYLVGFVCGALWADAIDYEELHQWAISVIERLDDPPVWAFNLSVFGGPMYDLPKVVGFIPDGALTKDEHNALEGISYKRGVARDETKPSRKTALRMLSQNPHIERRFREVFPFIDYPPDEGADDAKPG